MWEVFAPRDGVPVLITRFRVVARVVAWYRGLDFARVGEGWL